MLARGVTAGDPIALLARAPDSVALCRARRTAQAEFQRGVAALHNFEYEDANAAFLSAQQIDPIFAMAYWGEAMTYHQTLWQNEDVAAGRRALAASVPTPAARAAKAATDRDRRLPRSRRRAVRSG